MIGPYSPDRFLAALQERLAAFEIHPALGRRRVFLMAIHGEPWAGPGGERREYRSLPAPWRQPPWPVDDEPEENVLDAEPVFDESEFRALPVRGMVLCDAAGRYFERLGDHVRPLERLVRGSRGEWLELVPPPSAAPGVVRQAEQDQAEDATARADDFDDEPQVSTPGFRALLSEPGVQRIARLGDFRDLLGPQLSQPERLREMHQLPCCVQLYEARSARPLDEILSALKRAAGCEGVRPLTASAAQHLQLTPVLSRLPRVQRRGADRQPGWTVPGDRFFALRLIDDPTATSPSVPETPRGAVRGDAARKSTEPPPVAVPSLRNSAPEQYPPEQFLKPWEFQFSREEVLLNVQLAAAAGPLRRLWRRIRGWLAGGRELRKWQALLLGRNLEEQLWMVRPPRGSLTLPAVREWARRTLEFAGYDPRTMLLEWEIFWLRKGV